MKNVLKDRGIPFWLYEFINKSGEWSDSGNIDYIEPKDMNTLKKVLNCGWNSCYTIENGIVGRCARSIPAKTLQNLEENENDYLVLNSKLDIESVSNYFLHIKPMNACKHCKGSNGEPIFPAVQLHT